MLSLRSLLCVLFCSVRLYCSVLRAHACALFQRMCVCAYNDFIANFTAFSDALLSTTTLCSFIYLLHFSFTNPPMYMTMCYLFTRCFWNLTCVCMPPSYVYIFPESDTIKCCFSFFILFLFECIVLLSLFLPFFHLTRLFHESKRERERERNHEIKTSEYSKRYHKT